MRTRNVHGLAQLRFLGTKFLGNSSDLAEVVGAIHLRSIRVESVGKLFEASCRPLDLFV